MLCSIAEYFYEPTRRVKIQRTSKNSQRYYTTKCLIRDFLSNTPNCFFFVTSILARREKTCLTGPNWSTNIACYLYLFWALFVLYEAQLDNNGYYLTWSFPALDYFPLISDMLDVCFSLSIDREKSVSVHASKLHSIL